MAATNSQESPSSSSSSRCRYQVFLSFRGADTRKNFTSHLYKALVQAGIHAFRDDDEIRRGEIIELELQKAIRQSKMAIVVFSEDYAFSRWCLDELVMIMEQMRTTGWKVIPVFCHVDPSDVRKQTGSFGRAFVKHEKRPNLYEEMERVNGWRVALEKVADLGGMVLGERHEAEFVESIVKEVTKELNQTKFHVPYFIGRDSLLKDINSWLQSGSYYGEVAMLYGIGGVGKTTIAKIVCNQNFNKFESISFIGNIGQKSKQSNGLLSLQRQLLCDVLNKSATEIHDEDEGIMKIKDAICCKKILLVLDDVDDKDQFNALIRVRKWLYPGSKIIITTRVKGLFAIHEDCVKFKVDPLDEKESIELFSWHAFGQAHPVEEFVEHSGSVVSYCNGLPLALGAIGSSLSSTRVQEVWESALQEMENFPNSKVQEVLKISYKSLHDDHQKNLFLDVACFFIGMDVVSLVHILNGLDVGGKWRINNLIDRCLVEIDEHKRIWMHQLIRDMGREIARQESQKCQRIWHYKEAFNTMKESTGTEMVLGLALDMHVLMVDSQRKALCCENPLKSSLVSYQPNFLEQPRVTGFFSSEWLSNFFSEKQTSLVPLLGTAAFRKMKKMKFLQLNYVKFNGCYEHLPKSLIWLRWHGFSLRSIPKQFCLQKLVVLDMQNSSLVYVWEGTMSFPNLKILDLSHSHCLVRTPDLSNAPRLESLILEDCIHLVQIHQSIGVLRSLQILNLTNCKCLEVLPEEIRELDSLKKLVLCGCSNLGGPNMKLEQLQRRWSLHRDGIAGSIRYITAMPSKLFSPFLLSQTKNFRICAFSLPRFLVYLNLGGTPICCVPESIKCLTTLNALDLSDCRMLQTVPELPSSLYGLSLINCISLNRIAHLTPLLFFWGSDTFDIQEWMKEDFIKRFEADMAIHMIMIISCVIHKIQNVPSFCQIALSGNILNVYLIGGNFCSFFSDEVRLPTRNEFGEWTFKISTIKQGHEIVGLNLYTMLSIMPPSRSTSSLFVRITNNTKAQYKAYIPYILLDSAPIAIEGKSYNALWISRWKSGDDDLEFGDGDEVSVWVYSNDPNFQIKMVAIEALYKEEVTDNDESNNDAHVLDKAQIASYIFRYFPCYGRWIDRYGFWYSFRRNETELSFVHDHVFSNNSCFVGRG